MRFYRQLQPFKIISFDLDDTLYDNRSVIMEAEKQFLAALQRAANLAQLTLPYLSEIWREVKSAVAAAEPLLSEDVVRWRMVALERLLTQRAVSVDKIDTIISQVMADFVHWRHQIDVPSQSVEILNNLAQRYPLVAITNGNVEPHRIGLSQFSLCLRGGEHGRAKPHFDLFAQTMQHFQVRPHQILHIGDNLHTDVQGAIQAGCQAVWLNLNAEPIRRHAESRNLPTLELTDLQQLLFLA